MEQSFLSLLDSCKGIHIAVVGDLMLDRYLMGKADRISPEAPVPVVDIHDEFVLPGGAANVLQNLSALGVVPEPFGVIGEDNDGKTLRLMLEDFGCDSTGIFSVEDRPTTVKTRVLADSHHVVRFDREHRDDVSDSVAEQILYRLRDRIRSGEIRGIILQDYNKGVLRSDIITTVIRLANAEQIPILVDPKQLRFFEYVGVTVFKPNLREVRTALNRPIEGEESIVEAIYHLRELLKAEYILLTRGAKGMTLGGNAGITTIATDARKVADVSGAGDTVIATMAAIMGAGGDVRAAARVANCAAGIVVGEVGAVPVKLELLRDSVKNL